MKPVFSQADKQIVSDYVCRARTALPGVVLRAYWFGSRARGEGHSDSDYDLMLETSMSLSEEQRDILADIAVDLAADHGSLLDVHFYSRDQLKDVRLGRSPFVQTVHEEGLLL